MAEFTHAWAHDGRVTVFSWLEDGEHEGRVPTRVYAIAFTEGGQILLVGGGDERTWWLPGGGVEEGETPEAALRRELDERRAPPSKRMRFSRTGASRGRGP